VVPSRPGEDPLVAAQRQILEETGYISEDWSPLQVLHVQANYGGGRGHYYRARNIRQVAAPGTGDLEQIQVESPCPASSSPEMIRLLDCVAMIAMVQLQSQKS
jgi:ADP-ribose pyrophosphatase